ncbi:MAG: transcription-repair coupling factor, partial [Pseudomonadota bacterium]
MTSPSNQNSALLKFKALLADPGTIRLGSVPDGYEARILATALQRRMEDGNGADIVFIARDGQRAGEVEQVFRFFAPWAEVLHLPAWDCLPYDRVSPSNDVLATRINALSSLVQSEEGERPRLITLTPNAIMQRVPPREAMAQQVRRVKPGQRVKMDNLVNWLSGNGFARTPTVRDTGEFAVRGGILDLYAPGEAEPVRLDFSSVSPKKSSRT